MKRKIVLILALMLMFVSVHSIYADITKTDITFDSVQPASQLATLLRSKIGQINDEIALKTSNKGTGDIYYVDSNAASNGAGKSWFGAKTTLNAAIALCDDNNGDIIYIAQGHTEALGGVDGVDITVAGITVIGLGSGVDMPEFTYDAADDEFVIGAANVTVVNCRFVAGATSIVMGISVEDAGDYFTLYKCVFPKPTTNNWEFLDAIDVASGVKDIRIIGNIYHNDAAGAAPEHFIDLGNAALVGVYIADNIIQGDFTVSAIWSNDTDLEVYILRNIITNMEADAHCIEFTTGSALGVCAYNLLYTNAEATAIDPGSLTCFENYVSTATNVSGMLYPALDDGVTQLNATTINSIYTRLSALTGFGFIATADDNASVTTVDCTELEGFGDDYFNDGWSVVCFMNANSKGNDPEGEVRDITDYTSTAGVFTVAAFSAAVEESDEILVIRTHHLNPHLPALLGISADIWYCDDGGSNGDGMTWQTAKTTLKAAVALCGEGDTIYVGANHNETMTDTGSITLSDAGLTIIGMGEGDARPRLDYDEADSEITIGAAGITIKNIRFMPAITDTVAAIVVGSAGIGCLIENCAFVESVDAAGTDEFIDAITVNAAAANLTVKDCTYYNTAASGHNDTFINLDGGTIAGTSIIGCTVFGDFAEAPIWSDAALVNVLIKDNVLSNARSTKYAIQLTGNATGMLIGNRLYSDSFGTMLDPGYLKCIDNWGADAIDQQPIAMPVSADSSTVGEEDDGSNLERLEYLQNKSDDALALLRAAGGSVGDVFYLDDSGASGNDGTSWALAEDSLTNAYGDCSAGDILFISPDYTETIATGAPLTLATAGVTIIGLGNGDDRPTFSFLGANSSIDVGAADNVFDNIIFYSTTADTTIGIDIADAGDGTVIKNCEFKDTGGYEFATAIDLKDDADRVTIENNRFIGGVGCTEAIQSTTGTVDRLTIIGNTFYGTYSAAVIYSDQVDTHVLVKDNVVTNISTGVHCIEFTAAAEGELINNLMSGDVYGAILDPGSLKCFRNMQTVGVDASAIDVPLVAGKTYAIAVSVDEITSNILDIQNGGIMILSIFAEVDVLIGAGATSCKLTCDADDGAAWDCDLSTEVVITDDVAGTRWFMDDAGIGTNPPVLDPRKGGATEGTLSACPAMWVPEGLLIQSMNADPSGAAGDHITWYIRFSPIEDDVVVVPQ